MTAGATGEQKSVLDAADVGRAITRIAHEIVERNHGASDLAIVGVQRGGVWLARDLVAQIERIAGVTPPFGSVDVSLFRDDIGRRPIAPSTVTELDFEIDDVTVVLVDDVLYTGRTVKAALDAIGEYGRPSAVQLAVLVDRGHRELPIRPDFVGKNLPTSSSETVVASAEGVTIG